jgi:hypothetical protein
MQAVTTIGLDIAKSVFPGRGCYPSTWPSSRSPRKARPIGHQATSLDRFLPYERAGQERLWSCCFAVVHESG